MSETEEKILIIEVKNGDEILKVIVDEKFYSHLKSLYIWKVGKYLKIRNNETKLEMNLQRYIYFVLGENEIVEKCDIYYDNGDKLDNTLKNLKLQSSLSKNKYGKYLMKQIENNITYENKKYKVEYKNYVIGIFDEKNDALECYVDKREKVRQIENKKLLSEPIKRNEDGVAIIPLYNRKKELINNVLLDDDKYYEVLCLRIKYDGEYVCFQNKYDKKKRLARYLMNYEGNDIVDHVNRNKFDNRLFNLRILTRKQNNQNKSSKEGSSSKYVGVCLTKKKSSKKWYSYIYKDNKQIKVGYFESEELAAKERDKAALINYGLHANLNCPEDEEIIKLIQTLKLEEENKEESQNSSHPEDEDLASQIAVLKLTEEEKKGESSKSAQKSQSSSKSKGKQKMEEPNQNAP